MLHSIFMLGAIALPLAALSAAPFIARTPQGSHDLLVEVDSELIHRLWVVLDGPSRLLVTDAQVWRAIGGIRGLWKMWKQVRTMVGAIAERAKETQYCAEASMAHDDFHVASLLAIREWVTRSRQVHARACARAFLRVAVEFEYVRLGVDLV